MKLSEAMTRIKSILNVFKKEPEAEPGSKKKKIAIIVGAVAAVFVVGAGVFLLVRMLKKRRMEKEAAEESEEHYATDPDADEYADEETEEDVVRF